MDAFDADVLIYACVPGHESGGKVRRLFLEGENEPGRIVGIGSVLLLPELLSKPLRERRAAESAELTILLSRLDLRPVDLATAELAAALGAEWHLRSSDAVHLATAVNAGADRFITSNRTDFTTAITEIEITFPESLR
jgi:predicted nucleic acid-binding protein